MGANANMVGEPRLPPYLTPLAQLYGASETNLPRNQAISADFTIVPDLHQRIDPDTGPDPGWLQESRRNLGVRPNPYIRFDLDPGPMRQRHGTTIEESEPESGCAKNRAFSDPAVLGDLNSRVNHTTRTKPHSIADSRGTVHTGSSGLRPPFLHDFLGGQPTGIRFRRPTRAFQQPQQRFPGVIHAQKPAWFVHEQTSTLPVNQLLGCPHHHSTTAFGDFGWGGALRENDEAPPFGLFVRHQLA